MKNEVKINSNNINYKALELKEREGSRCSMNKNKIF